MNAIEDDLTRALGEHDLRGYGECKCGVQFIICGYSYAHQYRAHLAAVLAPIVAKHVAAGQERAWDEGWATGYRSTPQVQSDGFVTVGNPYRAATYTTTKEQR